jgi:hypothetical protein
MHRGVQKLTGENLEVVWAEFFNSKLGCIATLGSKFMACMQPLLKLKARPKAHPVS